LWYATGVPAAELAAAPVAPTADAVALPWTGAADTARDAHLARFRSDYARAVLGGRPEGLLRYYADDVRLMPEFQKTVMGSPHAASYHRAFAARFAVGSYSRRQTEVLDLGPRVVEHGVFTMRLRVHGTGEEHELTGKYQDVWARRPRGRLSLITQAWNYGHPTDLGPQLRFAAVPSVDVALRPHVPVDDAISFELAALNRLAEVTIAQHDARIWAQFYADDAVLMYSRHPAYAGRKAIDGFLAAHAQELPVFEALDIRTDRIDDLGRYVIEYASHIASFRVGAQSGVNTGKNTVIWRREPGGALRVYRGMAMYD
jgi:ketosteroid isomerase-like protein